MADLALRPLSLGELLDRAFTIFRTRFGTILLVLLACLVLPALMLLNNFRGMMELAQLGPTAANSPESARMIFAVVGKMIWVGLIAAVALTVARTALGWIAHKAMLGDSTDVGSALGKGLKLFLPMIGLLIVEAVIFVIVEVVLYLPMIFLGLGAAAAGGRGGAGVGLGLMLWMVVIAVAMLYLVAALFVSSATLIAEADTGVFKAIERSWTLTKGRRGTIMGAIVLVYLLVWIVMLGVSFGVGIVAGVGGSGPEGVGRVMTLMMGGMMLLGLLVSGYYYMLQMVTYYDLRVRKEGLDLELASAEMPPA
ncbi:MAG TPA: hypothetical protein VFS07_08985 [Gemmatimonadales bacterium]|nr:hypothetical protein [Gemmatimonadales bacterium]